VGFHTGSPGLVLFGSGFATIGYEIVWFRALHLRDGHRHLRIVCFARHFPLGLGLGGIFIVVLLAPE